MTSPSICPQCETAQHAVDVEFCFRCRFPLMLIAGKYRLEKLLAEGGQGAVYLARHTSLDLEPLRVIKIVKSELFEKIPNLGERFRREVQVTSALSQRCQHIVRIYDDFGEIPKLGRFYVMEHLEGRPLSDLLRDPMDLPNLKVCLHIFHQLCDAMRFAHREDIIHRDLKPDNLMLIPFEDEPLYLKVLDFGIARPTGEQASDAPKLTEGVVGTPEYMAPEQLTGQPIDARADLYAMGVILYEMLTGKTPHSVSGAGQEAFFELVMTRLREDPPRPSVVRPDLDIHPAIENVAMTLLRRPPNERYSRIEELKTALRDAAREVRRSAKTVLQDTAIEFGDDLSDAVLHFELQGLPDSSTRTPTIGYDGSIDNADTPHEAPVADLMVGTAPLGMEALPASFTPNRADTPGVETGYEGAYTPTSSLVKLSDSYEKVATSIAESPVALPTYANIVDAEDCATQDELAALPMLSDDEFDDETAIDQSPDAQIWLQGSINQAAPPDDATKESPSFHRPAGPSPERRSLLLGVGLGLLVVALALGAWWWFRAKGPKGPHAERRSAALRGKLPADRPLVGGPAYRPLVAKAPSPRPALPRKRATHIKPRPRPLRSRPRPLRRSRPFVRRRARRKPRRACPARTSRVHWLHLKMVPAQAKFTYLLGGAQTHRDPAKGQRCLGIRSGRVTLRIHAKGFRSCIVKLSRRTRRRLALRLKRLKIGGLTFGADDYCLGRW